MSPEKRIEMKIRSNVFMVNILSWLVDAKGIGIPVRDCGSFKYVVKMVACFSLLHGHGITVRNQTDDTNVF
jgi:hypothetical protein